MEPAMPDLQEMIGMAGRAVVLGVAGAAMMDVWALFVRRVLRARTLDYAMLGRWIGHFPRGRFAHASIAAAEPVRGERALGWGAHYAIGVTFAFALLVVAGAEWAARPTLWPPIAGGLVTLAAPWLVMQPAFGAGIAGSRASRPNGARLRNVGTHLAFGVGLYLAAWSLSRI